MTDLRRYYLLYVDDEERSLKSFDRAFGDTFRILTASNAVDAFKVFESHADEIAVVMTDQRMPGEKGVWLLDKVRQARPNVLRILVTAYSDLEAVIQAVNSGAIYHYVSKPWDPPQLANTLRHAIQLFSVQRERDELLRQKMAAIEDMMIADRIVSLGYMAAGLSHHIRNALVPVKTFIELVPQQLREEGIAPDASKEPGFWIEYQRTADENVEKINSLLRELWLVAETPSLGFTDQINLREVAGGIVASLGTALATRKISASVTIPESLPLLTVDKAKFTRMLELLIKDEIVSLPEGATIEISASVSPEQADHVQLVVRDNGPGLSAEILKTLFDPFTARSDSPTEHGINLMAVYFIVHYHAGKIEARSGNGPGTEFAIVMPFAPTRDAVSPHNTALFQKIRQTDQTWEKLLSTR